MNITISTREDLAKIAGALQDTAKLADHVVMLRDLNKKLTAELKSVRDDRNRLHDEVLTAGSVTEAA